MNENEWLIANVLEWRVGTKADAIEGVIPAYVNNEGTPIFLDSYGLDFRNNIEQAFMLLDKFDDWTVANVPGKGSDKYGCMIGCPSEGMKSRASNKLDAIVNCVLSASGWESGK